MDRVTVVIFTCDRPEDLRRCLDSVYAQTYKEFDILIVNNGSDISGIINDAQIRVVEDRKKKLSYLFNLGWKNSRTELVAYLADDVKLDSNWLESGLKSFKGYAGSAVITGPLVSPYEFSGQMHYLYSKAKKNKILNSLATFYNNLILDGRALEPCILCQSGGYTIGQGLEPDFSESREVDLATTSGMLIKRSAIEKIGGFDENFLYNHADGDLFIRLKKCGYKIIYNPEMRAVHYNRPGPSRNAYFIGRDTAFFYLKDIRPRSLRGLLASIINIFILNLYWIYEAFASRDIKQLKGVSGFIKGIIDYFTSKKR